MSAEGDSLPTADGARAELFYKLSQLARHRFNTRMSYEWKMCFGLWAAFGAAAGFVIGSESTPEQPILWFVATVVATIAAGFVVVAFHNVWKHIYKSYDRDRKTAYYWESAIESVATDGDSNKLLPKIFGHVMTQRSFGVGTGLTKEQLSHETMLGRTLFRTGNV